MMAGWGSVFVRINHKIILEAKASNAIMWIFQQTIGVGLPGETSFPIKMKAEFDGYNAEKIEWIAVYFNLLFSMIRLLNYKLIFICIYRQSLTFFIFIQIHK